MARTTKDSGKTAATKQKPLVGNTGKTIKKSENAKRKKKAKDKPQNSTTQAGDMETEVRVKGKDVAKWKTISKQTLDFFTAIIEANINSLLVNTTPRMYEETQQKFMALRKELQSELSTLKGPLPTEHYAKLKQDQITINQELHECSEDISMVQDETDRLNELIDKNKSELLRLQQRVTLMQNRLQQDTEKT